MGTVGTSLKLEDVVILDQHQCEYSARDFCGWANQVPHHLQLL